METRYKSFSVKADGVSDDGGTITGYASTFDREPDSYGDIVAKGAFADSLKAWEECDASIPFLFGHRTDDPAYNIGRVVEIGEDDRGLRFTAVLDGESEKAQYVRKLYREGRIYQFSFAYAVIDQMEVELGDGRKANELRKLDIYEISAVQIPANQHAEVIEVKGSTATTVAGPAASVPVDEVALAVEDALGVAVRGIDWTYSPDVLPELTISAVAYDGIKVARPDAKTGRRNSKADEDELRRVLELADAIIGIVNGLLSGGEPDEQEVEPDAGAPEAKAEEPGTANAEEPGEADADVEALLKQAREIIEKEGQ